VWYYYYSLSVKSKHPGEIWGGILFVNIVVTSVSGRWLADEWVWSFVVEFCVKIDEVWDIAIKNNKTNRRWGRFMLTNTELMWSEPRWWWICVRIWCTDEFDRRWGRDMILFDGPMNLRAELPWNDDGDELYDWMGTMIEHLSEVQRLVQPVIFRRFFKWKTGFYYFYCR